MVDINCDFDFIGLKKKQEFFDSIFSHAIYSNNGKNVSTIHMCSAGTKDSF